jgi:cobalamin biosynthesis Mg chelatase CobN
VGAKLVSAGVSKVVAARKVARLAREVKAVGAASRFKTAADAALATRRLLEQRAAVMPQQPQPAPAQAPVVFGPSPAPEVAPPAPTPTATVVSVQSAPAAAASPSPSPSPTPAASEPTYSGSSSYSSSSPAPTPVEAKTAAQMDAQAPEQPAADGTPQWVLPVVGISLLGLAAWAMKRKGKGDRQ